MTIIALEKAEELWCQMELRFQELRDLITTARFETFEEARDRSYPLWYDDDVGQNVRAWLLIPYRQSINQDLTLMQHQAANTLIPALEAGFAERELSAEFLSNWGKFCDAAGAINTLFLSEGDDVATSRAAKARGDAVSKHPQRKWVAHLLSRLIARGTARERAEDMIADYVAGLIDTLNDPPPFDRAWFEKMLDGGKRLTTGFQYKALGPGKIRTLIAEPTIDIPPLPDLDRAPWV